jgi:hypothetical protein
VCGRGDERRSADSIEGRSVRTAGEAVSGGGSGLTLVDLGRLDDDDPVSSSWLELAELSVVVIRGDVSSAVQVRVRAQRLIDSCGGKVAVVVVGGSHTSRDVAEFTGLLPLADLPSDPSAADLASGAAGGLRRLERSPLWAAVGRLTSALVPLLIETGQLGPELPDGAGPTGVTPPDPASTSEAVARGRGSFGPAVRRLRTTAGRRPTEIGRARS